MRRIDAVIRARDAMEMAERHAGRADGGPNAAGAAQAWIGTAVGWMLLSDRLDRNWTCEQEREWIEAKPLGTIMPTDPEWPGKVQDS